MASHVHITVTRCHKSSLTCLSFNLHLSISKHSSFSSKEYVFVKTLSTQSPWRASKQHQCFLSSDQPAWRQTMSCQNCQKKKKNTSGTPEEIPGNERNTEEFIRPESQIHIFVCHFYLFSVQDLPPWPFSQRAKPGDGVWEPKNHRFISCFSNAIWVWNFGMDIYIYIWRLDIWWLGDEMSERFHICPPPECGQDKQNPIQTLSEQPEQIACIAIEGCWRVLWNAATAMIAAAIRLPYLSSFSNGWIPPLP